MLKKIFSKKLLQAMEKFNVDRYRLSDDLDIPYSTIGAWIQGLAFPRAEVLESLSAFFNVPVSYFVSDESTKTQNSVAIKVFGTIPAGIPLEAIEDITDYEEIPIDWTLGNKEYIALKVTGDSMYPNYIEGDTIIVLLQSDFSNGQDCVVFVNGYNATLKRCYRTEEGIQLKPLNVQYPPKTYGKTDDDIKILGIVKEIRRKI